MRSALMPGKIFIVEANTDSREILVINLGLLTIGVIGAVEAQEGIEKAQAENPNLIIMDLGLPGIDGIETTVRLKQNPKTAHIPVIALTAWQEPDYKDKALPAGMAGVFSKPTPPRILKDAIERSLRGKS